MRTSTGHGNSFRGLTAAMVTACSLAYAGIPEGMAQQLLNDSAITVTAVNAATKRNQLIYFIWGRDGFPSGLPTASLNIPAPVSGLPNLSRVDMLTVNMNHSGFDESNITHHYIPKRKNNRLVILMHGHGCSFDDMPADPTSDAGYGLERTLSTLLKEGFSVLTAYMPHMRPGQCEDISHATLMARSLTTGNPLRWFMGHLAVSMNYLKTKSAADGFPIYRDYSMVGLSGGGWSTVLYAALDPTIKVSIPVSGSIPLYLRSGGSVGDTEQFLAAFYSIAGYPDLYVLGSSGADRRQVQVLNRLDTCCFGQAQHNAAAHGPWDTAMRTVETNVRTGLFNMSPSGNGFFRLEIDEAATEHTISWNTVLNTIMAELNHGRRIMGSKSNVNAFVRGLNGNLWQRSGASWSDTAFAMTGAPAVLEAVNHTIDVFYRGPGNQMSHAYYNGAAWSTRLLGGGTVTDPVATSWGGIMHVVGMGGGNRHPYYWKIAADNTASPAALVSSAVKFIGQPALVAASDGLHLYGIGVDRKLYHLRSNSPSNPTSWPVVEAVGGETAGYVTAVRDGATNRAFVRGVNSDHIWEAASSGGAWTWTNLNTAAATGVLFTGSPSASMNGADTYVYARANTGNLVSFRRAGGVWQPSQNTSTNLSGSPVAIGPEAWVRGTSGKLWRWNGATWTDLGGQFY